MAVSNNALVVLKWYIEKENMAWSFTIGLLIMTRESNQKP